MPPRVSTRRSNRVLNRDSESSPATPGASNLSRPSLPMLNATPSSRRQYSYGGAADPPSRPGHALHKGQVLDLSQAVKLVRSRQQREREEEEEQDAREQRLRPTKPQSRVDRQQDQAGQERARPLGEFDTDSLRSFGMESDVYGDATIRSTPGGADSDTSDSRPVAKNRASALNGSSKLAPVTEENPAPGQKPTTQPTAPEESDEEDDALPLATRRAALKRNQSTNTPGVKRLEQLAARGQKPAGSGPTPARPPDPEARTERPGRDGTKEGISSTKPNAELQPKRSTRGRPKRTKDADEIDPLQAATAVATGRQSLRPTHPIDVRKRLDMLSREDSGRPSLFAQSADLAKSNSAFRPESRTASTNYKERDAAIQKEITEAEEQVARERRERELEARREMWRERWAWLKTFSPLRLIPPRHRDDETQDDEEVANNDTTNWWLLLHPWTYVETTLWLIDRLMDSIVNLIDQLFSLELQQRLVGLLKLVSYALVILAASLLAGSLLSTAVAKVSSVDSVSAVFPSVSDVHSIRWPSLGGLVGTIGEYIPSVSWPSRSHWDDLPDLWELDDGERSVAEDYIKRYENEFRELKKAGKLHEASLKKLETVVPKVVHMLLKDGKPVVSSEFYHALRDLMHTDGVFLAMEKKGKAYEVSSDEQWRAITAKLVKDPTFTSKLNVSIGDAEDRIGSKMNNFWDSWVKTNDERILKILGPELEKVQSAGSARDFDDRLAKLVKDQIQGKELKDLVVTRDEFLRHLKNEFATHRGEITAELKELQPQLQQLIRDSVGLATKTPPEGMSRAEVTKLVDELVRRKMANMNLEAMAKGKIHVHWDHELRNQVNYFAIGAGAIIDPVHSSSTYDPYKKGVASDDETYSKGRTSSRGLLGARPLGRPAALTPWQDEGECWCAARSINHRGNPHGASLSVQLSHLIVPQQLVIEHILPGATSDPGARPRDIEVYAHIGDSTARSRLRDFAATHFPGDNASWDFTPAALEERFVQIGRFVYEEAGAALHDGVSVHQFSGELAALGAETDQVVVRAVSNYGAEGHTCFYRLRLFGERVEGDV